MLWAPEPRPPQKLSQIRANNAGEPRAKLRHNSNRNAGRHVHDSTACLFLKPFRRIRIPIYSHALLC